MTAAAENIQIHQVLKNPRRKGTWSKVSLSSGGSSWGERKNKLKIAKTYFCQCMFIKTFSQSLISLVQISWERCLRRLPFVHQILVPFVVNCRNPWKLYWIHWNIFSVLSVQTAGVVLERCHVDLIAQPLDLEILEMVIFIVLNDYFLQFVDLALHPGSQLSLHLQQSLSKRKDQ